MKKLLNTAENNYPLPSSDLTENVCPFVLLLKICCSGMLEFVYLNSMNFGAIRINFFSKISQTAYEIISDHFCFRLHINFPMTIIFNSCFLLFTQIISDFVGFTSLLFHFSSYLYLFFSPNSLVLKKQLFTMKPKF